MATQALISSSSISTSAEAARQIIGSRISQSVTRKASFVVRAASTPPVKVIFYTRGRFVQNKDILKSMLLGRFKDNVYTYWNPPEIHYFLKDSIKVIYIL